MLWALNIGFVVSGLVLGVQSLGGVWVFRIHELLSAPLVVPHSDSQCFRCRLPWPNRPNLLNYVGMEKTPQRPYSILQMQTIQRPQKNWQNPKLGLYKP